MTRPKLTDRQRQALTFIREFAEASGKMPTLDEIRKHLGSRSRPGVYKHLDALVAKGYIRRGEPYTGRAIELVGYEFRLVKVG